MATSGSCIGNALFAPDRSIWNDPVTLEYSAFEEVRSVTTDI